MSQKSENKIDDINQLMAMAGTNLNILEEEVDMKVQKQYFDTQDMLSNDSENYQQTCKQYIENINDLCDETIDEELKKRMLVILATIDDVTIYRAIENFSKQNTPLQKWAIIALQQSRMLIQSTLLDDPGVFISTGLGGQGLLLRYFCVFVNKEIGKLEEFQRNIIRNEATTAITALKGSVEQTDFSNAYTTMLVLLPIETDLHPLFTSIIDECNLYGNFLHENMVITNVKKLSDSEIHTILHSNKSARELNL